MGNRMAVASRRLSRHGSSNCSRMPSVATGWINDDPSPVAGCAGWRGKIWGASMPRCHMTGHMTHTKPSCPTKLANHTKFHGTFCIPPKPLRRLQPTPTQHLNHPHTPLSIPQRWRTTVARSSICKPQPSRTLQPIEILTLYHQLRPPQVQRHQPHHQGQGPRFRPDLDREGR